MSDQVSTNFLNGTGATVVGNDNISLWRYIVTRRWRGVQVQEMEWDKKDLERQLNELKLKFEQSERAAIEQRQVDEKKHAEEIQFLKRTNQQLKVCNEPWNLSRT